MEKRPLIRFLSATLCVLYFATNCVFVHAAESNVWAERHRQLSKPPDTTGPLLASLPAVLSTPGTPGALLNQLPSITATLPTNPRWTAFNKKLAGTSKRFQTLLDSVSVGYGTIQDVYDAGNDLPSVVLIQDVHLNSEAQINIASLIHELIDSKQVGLIGVEGAFQPFDFKPFRTFPDQRILRDVSAAYLEENLLAAPAFVGITNSNGQARFVGVDDREHYRSNVSAYLTTRETKSKVKTELEKAQRALSKEKEMVFSPELKKLDALITGYHTGAIGFGAYLMRLYSYRASTDFAIEQFLAAYEMESKLDFNRVDQERKVVLNNLTNALTKRELSNLLDQSLAYRLGQLSFGDYYRGLKELCENKGIALGRTPAFDDYIRYVFMSDGVKAEPLFNAVSRLEQNVLRTFAKTSKEKQMESESAYLSLAGKLVDFSLTPQEWNQYKTLPTRGEFGCEPFEAFYREADIRSQKIVNNLLAPASPGHRVLVAGGFHTPELARLLRDRKISYVIMSPKISKTDEKSSSAYLSIFSREKTPLDRLFAGERLFVSPSMVAGAGTPDGIETARRIFADTAARTVRAGQTLPANAPALAEYVEGNLYRVNEPEFEVLVDTDKKPGNDFQIPHRVIVGTILSFAVSLSLFYFFPELPKGIYVVSVLSALFAPFVSLLFGFKSKRRGKTESVYLGQAVGTVLELLPENVRSAVNEILPSGLQLQALRARQSSVLYMAKRRDDADQTMSSSEGGEVQRELRESGVDPGFIPELARELAGLHFDLKVRFPRMHFTLRDLMQVSRFIRINAERLGIGGAVPKGLEFVYGGRLSAIERPIFDELLKDQERRARIGKLGIRLAQKTEMIGIERAQRGLAEYMEFYLQDLKPEYRSLWEPLIRKLASHDFYDQVDGLYSLRLFIDQDPLIAQMMKDRLGKLYSESAAAGIPDGIMQQEQLNILVCILGFQADPRFDLPDQVVASAQEIILDGTDPDVERFRDIETVIDQFRSEPKREDLIQAIASAQRRLSEEPSTADAGLAIVKSPDEKTIAIQDAVLTVREPRLDERTDDVPKLEDLDPVYTDNLVANMEAVAFSAEGKFALLLEGVTALGKSFAIKVVAALRQQPLVAVGMHPALTSYELIGGYHPTGDAAQVNPKEALDRLLERQDQAQATGDWSLFEEALEQIGWWPPEAQNGTSVQESLQKLLTGDLTQNARSILALHEYLQRKKENRKAQLVWEDGFLVKAMRQGKWLVLEELNLAPTEVLEVLNLYLVHGKLIVTQGSRRVEYSLENGNIHSDFRLFATMNPIETGGGRVDISEALLDRFIQRRVSLSEEQTQKELAAVASKKFGLESGWAQSLAKAHMDLSVKAALWRKPIEAKEPYNFNSRHLLRLGARLDPTKWENLSGEAKAKEIVRQLAGNFWEIYGDALRLSVRKDELFSILNDVFDLSARGITRQDLETFDPHISDLAKGPGKGPSVPGNEQEIAPIPSVERLQKKISRNLSIGESRGKPGHVLLTGPPASSKTSAVYDLFRQLGRALHYVNVHGSMDFEALVGGYVPTGKKGVYRFQPGPLVQAMLSGEAIFMDEMNLSLMPEWFNTVLDEGILYLPGQTEPIRAKKGFVVIAAVNPATQEGRQVLSAPLRTRFHEIWVDEIKDPEELKAIVSFRLRKGGMTNPETIAADIVATHIKLARRFPKADYGLRNISGWADFITANTGVRLKTRNPPR